jgi:uncharacterized membrane protein
MPRQTRWARRFRIRQHLKGSLWFLPLLGALLGPLLAFADLSVERMIDVPSGWTYTADTASGILTAIVGAMVALLGFVVTIGVLVVQTATGTLSPRFMRIWYRDRLQKVVLGTFAGTLTFSFALLRRIDEGNVPNVGVTLAGVMVTVSLVLLLLYLDRFTHRLRPVAVAALMARAGLRVAQAAPPTPDAAAFPGPGTRAPAALVRAERSGVVQALHVRGLVEEARRTDALLLAVRTPGDFVAAGATVLEVHAPRPVDARALAGMVAIDDERTIDQDPAFALRIIVDIAIRALSPAVNDPTTAVQSIDQIEVFLCGVAQLGPNADVRAFADHTGTPRLVVPARRLEAYLDLGLTEVIRYGAGAPQVCRRLAALLDTLDADVDPRERAAVEAWRVRLEDAVVAAFPDHRDRDRAAVADPQGIGRPHPAPLTVPTPPPTPAPVPAPAPARERQAG